MAEMHNFRTALGGFNREDVVHYIEYLNKKHSIQVNQLESEKNTIRKELEAEQEALQEAREKLAQRENDAVLREFTAENEKLRNEIAQLKQELEQARENAAQELETYRRAERMERAARERSDLIFRQAVGALGEATAMVDGEAAEFTKVSQRVSEDIALLQQILDRSGTVLQSASATMYAIRPKEEEQE